MGAAIYHKSSTDSASERYIALKAIALSSEALSRPSTHSASARLKILTPGVEVFRPVNLASYAKKMRLTIYWEAITVNSKLRNELNLIRINHLKRLESVRAQHSTLPGP